MNKGLKTKVLLKTVGVAFLYFFCFQTYAQQKDALLQKLEAAKHDTSKINILNELAANAIVNGTPNAFNFAKKANILAKKINYINGLGKSYSNLGYCLLNSGKFDSAIIYFDLGIVTTQKYNSKVIYSELLNRKGVAYYYKGNTDSALCYFTKSLVQFELLKDSLQTIKILNNIGAISLRVGNMSGALTCFFKCLSYDEKQKNLKYIAMDCDNIGIILTNKKDFISASKYCERAFKLNAYLKDTAGMLKSYLNIANIYEAKKEYEEGIKQLKIALNIIDTNKHLNEYARIMNNLGSCYSSLNDFKNASFYLIKSLGIKKQLGDRHGIAATLGNIGGIYYKQKKYDKAVEYYVSSNTEAIETGSIEFQRNAQKTLAECYIQLNQKNNAVDAFHNLVKLQDSLYKETSVMQATEIQIKYETEKKERENKLLKQENDIKTLENENNQQKLKVRNQTILILIATVIVVIIIVFWQISLAKIKKQKRELENEKTLQKQKERISRDLHDNVGGQLSYVLYSLDGITQDDKALRVELSKNLNESVRAVINNLRETIWAINDDSISMNDFSDKLKVYVRTMFKNTNTKIIFYEDITNNIHLNSSVGLNLYRICQEIVNNAFKHSNANELKINISSHQQIKIEIIDNGIGFDADNKSDGSFGLSNINGRANEMGITINLLTKPLLGAAYTLVV